MIDFFAATTQQKLLPVAVAALAMVMVMAMAMAMAMVVKIAFYLIAACALFTKLGACHDRPSRVFFMPLQIALNRFVSTNRWPGCAEAQG